MEETLLRALLRSVTIDSHGTAITWPIWNYLRSELCRAHPGTTLTDWDHALAALVNPGETRLPLAWRSEPGRGGLIQPNEQVGLSIAGLALVDEATANGLAALVAAAAKAELTLPAPRDEMPQGSWSINDNLPHFLPYGPRVDWEQMNPRTVADILKHEPISLGSETGFQFVYEFTLGIEPLGLFTEAESVADYLAIIRREIAARGRLSAMVTSDSAEAIERLPGNRSVFLVHGRNKSAAEAMREFLRSLDLWIIEWSQARSAARQAKADGGPVTTLEVVSAGLQMADAVIVLFTPDDQVRLHEKLTDEHDPDESNLVGQARPNVILEAGMAWALDRTKVEIVVLGKLRSISDIDGINFLRMGDSRTSRQALLNSLQNDLHLTAAGVSTGRWIDAGQFDNSIADLDASTPLK